MSWGWSGEDDQDRMADMYERQLDRLDADLRREIKQRDERILELLAENNRLLSVLRDMEAQR